MTRPLPHWPVYQPQHGRIPNMESWAHGDTWPGDESVRQNYGMSIAEMGAIYGAPLVQQFEVLHRFAVADSDLRVGFTRFLHDSHLAKTDYGVFTTPNVDTLYSNAWLDLSQGPVRMHLPDFGDRYFTAQILDAHCSSTNISPRAGFPHGGSFLIGLPEDILDCGKDQQIPVDTPDAWILLRIQVRGDDDVPNVRHIQTLCTLNRVRVSRGPAVNSYPAALPDGEGSLRFWRRLDLVLRRNGIPLRDAGHVHLFKTLLALATDEEGGTVVDTWQGILDDGWSQSQRTIAACVTTRGVDMGNGWRALISGNYGTNYLHRAVTNYVGLGGTTREENAGFVCHQAADGSLLDGHKRYVMSFTPPKVAGFWSLVAYDSATRTLLHGSASHIALQGEGSDLGEPIEVHMSTDQPTTQGRWLPIPTGEFFLVLRCYAADESVVNCRYIPAPVFISD